jgi:hypothetical protein
MFADYKVLSSTQHHQTFAFALRYLSLDELLARTALVLIGYAALVTRGVDFGPWVVLAIVFGTYRGIISAHARRRFRSPAADLSVSFSVTVCFLLLHPLSPLPFPQSS